MRRGVGGLCSERHSVGCLCSVSLSVGGLGFVRSGVRVMDFVGGVVGCLCLFLMGGRRRRRGGEMGLYVVVEDRGHGTVL